MSPPKLPVPHIQTRRSLMARTRTASPASVDLVPVTHGDLTAATVISLTADQVDAWWDKLAVIAADVREAVGLLLYWELRERPGSYHAVAERKAITTFNVTAATLTRWRTKVQEMHQLDPPDRLTASNQRRGAAVRVQKAKPQVTTSTRQTRTTPDLPERKTGAIDTTASNGAPPATSNGAVGGAVGGGFVTLELRVASAPAEAFQAYAAGSGLALGDAFETVLERAGVFPAASTANGRRNGNAVAGARKQAQNGRREVQPRPKKAKASSSS